MIFIIIYSVAVGDKEIHAVFESKDLALAEAKRLKESSPLFRVGLETHVLNSVTAPSFFEVVR